MHPSPCLPATVLALFLVAISPSATALELKVTNIADADWEGTLRSAIHIINRTPGDHTIRLPAGNYTIWSEGNDDDLNVEGDLDVLGNVTIIGAGTNATRFWPTYGGRVFDVLPGAKVTIRNLAISGGIFNGEGVAIRNRGELQLRDVHLTGNSLRLFEGADGRGGAIANFHRLSVHRSVFSDNLIFKAYGGQPFGKYLGAAIYNSGELTVRDSLFSNNLVYEGSTSSGGAIHSEGALDIARSAFIGNRTDGTGAAINSAAGAAIISNSTFAGNNALYGGVIGNGGTGSTPASMQLIHLSIAHNNALGVDNQGELLLRNSLIISNRKNCRSAGEQASFRMRGLLLGSWTDIGCSADTWFDDGLADSHVLEALQTVDGLPVYPLRAGSPGIDTASGSCSSHDQRSVSRPRDGDGDGVSRCDLGAYER